MSSGRAFHTVGASKTKLLPNCLTDLCIECLNFGMTRILPPFRLHLVQKELVLEERYGGKCWGKSV